MTTLRLARFTALAGLLVATALVGGTIIGSVAAATAPPSTRPDPIAAAPSPIPAAVASAASSCADFRRAFAAALGVHESALAPAAQTAAIAAIDAAVAKGTITKVAADRRKARVERVPADACRILAGRIAAAARAGGRAPRGVQVAHDGLAAAATALGMTPGELGADLRAGQRLTDVAATKHVPYATISVAVLTSVKADLDVAVAAGTLAQTRADRILARLQASLVEGRLRTLAPVAPRSVAPGG